MLLLCALLSLIGIGIGCFLMSRPAAAIECQRKFYLKINWRIEPVSMEKELRATRLMGLCVILVLAAVLILLFVRK